MSKKSIVPIVLMIVALVAVSGCTSNTGNNTTSVKNDTVNGISFNYPSGWTISNTTSDMILITKDSDTNTHVTIQTLLSTGGLSNNNMIPTGNFTKVSNTTVTVNNITANEVIYKDGQLQYATIYFSKNGKSYIINFQTPINNFDQEKKNLDIVVNNLTVQ